MGYIRESEKSFRETFGGYIEEELYKDAFLTLLTFFETLVKRGAYRKAKQVYRQATDLLAQSGSHEQMRQVWSQLLQAIEAESLKGYQVPGHPPIRRPALERAGPAPARLGIPELTGFGEDA